MPRSKRQSSKISRFIIGCMTGTSLDGLDAALIEVTGSGLAMSVRFIRGVTHPLGDTGAILKRFASGEALTAESITSVSREFALLHATAVKDLLQGETADLIAVHGQTVFHKPPLSWQLFNPAVLAVETGSPVVSDFRSLDLARGGEGAPITPLSDFISFRSTACDRVVVNFGGFINITLIPKRPMNLPEGSEGLGRWLDSVTGRDVCVCNQLLDRAAMLVLGKPFDQDGACAMMGRCDPAAQESLAKALRDQAEAGRSLGDAKEPFRLLERLSQTLRPADLLRTACASIGLVLAECIGSGGYDLLVAGGGIRNLALLNEVSNRCGRKVTPTDEYGIPAGFREAIAMAALGGLAMDGCSVTLPSVTRAPVGSGPAGWTYLSNNIGIDAWFIGM